MLSLASRQSPPTECHNTTSFSLTETVFRDVLGDREAATACHRCPWPNGARGYSVTRRFSSLTVHGSSRFEKARVTLATVIWPFARDRLGTQSLLVRDL